MSFISRNLFLATSMLMLPIAADSATVTYQNDIRSGQLIADAAVVKNHRGVEFRYNVLDALDISSFTLWAEGKGSGEVGRIRYGLFAAGDQVFRTPFQLGITTFGQDFLNGRHLEAGDTFSVFFADGIKRPISLALSFNTLAPSPVPLPASGALLGGALLAIGVFTNRKRRKHFGAVTA